jgi:hypothetical protein
MGAPFDWTTAANYIKQTRAVQGKQKQLQVDNYPQNTISHLLLFLI